MASPDKQSPADTGASAPSHDRSTDDKPKERRPATHVTILTVIGVLALWLIAHKPEEAYWWSVGMVIGSGMIIRGIKR